MKEETEITPVNLSFQYPITAIVGENGSGKSTILALVTCAFHNFGLFLPRYCIYDHVLI